MAITYISNALGATNSTTSFSITLPTTQAGDIIILEFTHRGTGDGTIGGTYSGPAFAQKHSQLYGSSLFSGKTLWSRATGNHSGQTVTGSGLTNSCAAIVTVYRGALAAGDPLNDATIVGEQNASGNVTQAQITTATNGSWVVLVVVNSPDYAISSQACTSPTLVERAERLSTGGTDTSIAHASGEKVTAGATGAFTWAQTNAASGSWAYAIKDKFVIVDTETSIIAAATVTASSGAVVGSVASIVGDATTAASSGTVANSVASIIGAATVTGLSLNAILDQMGYRWRNDDGSESAATWAAAINTALPVTVSSNIQKRLRFAVSNTVANPKAAFPQLQAVKREPAQDPWTNVSVTGFGASVVRGLAYGANKWVAVGHDGKLATSPSGEFWTHRTSSFGTSYIYGVCYNGTDQWVAVGDVGKIATSPDGINWTQQTSSFGSSAIWIVVYNGTDQYVAVADSGKIATSPDGETWTQQTSSFGTTAIYRIAYNGTDQYAAVGDSGKLATSPDGETWTQQTSSFDTTSIWGVASNRTDQWVAGGPDVGFVGGKIATSPDGETWTQQSPGFGANLITRVEYGAGEYTAVGSGGKIATSPDGINWTHQTNSLGASTAIWCAAFNGAHQWAAGGNSGSIATLEFTYFDVTTVSSVVRAFDSANVADDADTTQQITTGTFVADNNGLSEDGLVSRVLFNGVDKAEFEYTVEFVAADLADGDEVRFRIKAS